MSAEELKQLHTLLSKFRQWRDEDEQRTVTRFPRLQEHAEANISHVDFTLRWIYAMLISNP